MWWSQLRCLACRRAIQITTVNVTVKKNYLKNTWYMLFAYYSFWVPIVPHADAGWNPMASLLSEGPLFILSHLCSSVVIPGSFWLPGDGSTSHTYWGHRSINRYISRNFTNWPSEPSLKWPITTQPPSLPHFPSYPHIVDCFSSYSGTDLCYSIQTIVF